MRIRHVGALLAAVVLCAACTSSVSGKGAGQAGSAATSSSASTPVSSPVTSAAGRSGSSDWATQVDFATLPHADMACAAAGLGAKVDVLKVVSADVTGDGVPEAIVRLQCAHSASEWPDTVDVYSDSSGTPTLIGSLLTKGDSSYAPTVTTSGESITLGLLTWSSFAPGCCPDLNYMRTFTWTGQGFTKGPLVAVLRPCGDTALDVTSGSAQGATGHSSVVLLFRNRLPVACTIQGYPGVDAVTSGGAVLAHATRTLNGFSGGAHSVSTITVGAGHTVSASLEWLNFNPVTSGSCTTSASIMVTPANTTATVSQPVHVTVCGLQIHPTVAGTTGDA